MNTTAWILNHAIPLAALIVSVVSLFISIRTARRQAPLTQRQIAAHDAAAEQMQRARVIVELTKSQMWGGGPRQAIVLRNDGPAEARTVNLHFPNGDSPIPADEARRKLPIPVLAAGSKFELIAGLSMDNSGPFQVHVTWSDPSGERIQDQTLA